MALTINEVLSEVRSEVRYLPKPASATHSTRPVEPPSANTTQAGLAAARSGLTRYKPGHARQGAGLALLAEAVLLAVAIVVFNNSTSIKKAAFESVPIVLLTEKAPPTPQEKTIPLPPLKHKLNLPEPKVVALPPEPLVVAPPLPAAQTQNTITQPLPPVPPPRQSSESDPNIEYAAKVRAAVQAAVYYPPAALAMRYSGRVRVEFHLRDGIPGQAHILIGSSIGMIDRAALESVQNAHYPAPPPELRGNDGLYQVWVEFTH